MVEHHVHDHRFILILIGDSGVGKTNLLLQFSRNQFNLESKPNNCVEIDVVNINVDDKIIRAQILDAPGEERYRELVGTYYRCTIGALIVYDITRKVTFENVERWLKELRDRRDQNIVIMLVGNKADQINLRSVQREDALSFSERVNINLFMETSALDKSSVNNAFTKLLAHIYKHVVLSKKGVDMANHHMVEPKGQTKNVGGHEDVGITRASTRWKIYEYFLM
ncbi:unnamed protein product [Lactuca virosa]|uniref:Uncharacterized protein n=1 Tax=Lactuca virosa TaxID=75947 RepID=A0AAU9MEV8_9ASTR|nr:unnamed protein product [Lactuca virosa]